MGFSRRKIAQVLAPLGDSISLTDAKVDYAGKKTGGFRLIAPLIGYDRQWTRWERRWVSVATRSLVSDVRDTMVPGSAVIQAVAIAMAGELSRDLVDAVAALDEGIDDDDTLPPGFEQMAEVLGDIVADAMHGAAQGPFGQEVTRQGHIEAQRIAALREEYRSRS